MFTRRALSFILAILWLWPTSLHAQSKALMEVYRQGQTLYGAGRYEEAVPLFRRALELGEGEFGPDHPTTAVFINNLAVLYKTQGRYEAAEPLYKRALAIWEKALGPEHPDLATSLENYAALLRETGRNADASAMEARAKAIRAKRAKENK